MRTLTRLPDILDLNKLTSSPMKMPIGVPPTVSYTKKTDIVTPCSQHQQQHSYHHHQKNTITPQPSSSSAPSFASNGGPNSQSPRRRYRRVFSFLGKQSSKNEPSPTTTTTLQIKNQKPTKEIGSTSWNMFRKSSNRSLPSHQQQPSVPSSSHGGGGGVFVSADKPLTPDACTCTGPTTLKMDRVKPSYDSSTITTVTTGTTATTTTRHLSGGLRTLPSPGDRNMGNQKKMNRKKVYDASQWPCVLVQDTIEQDRLVAQHYLLRTAFDGDHHAPVQSLLSQRQQPSVFSNNRTAGSVGGTTASASSSMYSGGNENNNNCSTTSSNQAENSGPIVLDVGCGLGQWSMEMATMYPKSTFIGIDILPTYPKDIKPRNCHFLQVNVKHLPLPFASNSIDFIYQRDLNWGLGQDDWYPLIKEYLRILKPGGWIELVEADMETKSSLEKECAMNDKLLEGFSKRRQDPYVARRLPTMLAVHGFRRVESHFQSLPLGRKNYITIKDGDGNTHPAYDTNGSTPERQVQAMSSQYLFYLRSLGPWLRLVMGLSQSKYIDYVDQLPLEWEIAQTYVNWHCATAQKPYE